jgi:Sap, sulfolipid-1-addressing protein
MQRRSVMADAIVALIAYGLLATLSPLGFAATLAVIESGRPRSIAFGIAFVLAQLVACALVIGLDTTAGLERRRDYPVLRGILELVFGVALLVLAALVWRRPKDGGGMSTEGSRAVLSRLQHVRWAEAIVGGLLLGIGGPKRLVLTILAATSISASGAGRAEAAALVAFYTAIATFLVWAPILVFALFGDRAIAKLHATASWFSEHQRSVAFASLLTIGALAVADALGTLL